MKSVVVTKYGSPDNLKIEELPTPTAGPGGLHKGFKSWN